MGITLKKTDLQAAMDEALDLAGDPTVALPANWMMRTEIMGKCPAKTYVAVFGAALLAKATNNDVDALTLQFKAGANAMNARNPAGLMWEYSRSRGFDFGDTGSDPHQSRPFTNRPRVDDIPLNTTRESDRKYLEIMVVWLRDLNRLKPKEAMEALAAYLRVQTAVRVEDGLDIEVTSSAATLGLLDLAQAVHAFITADPEDGGRGQAAVAASFRAAGRNARTRRPNDPSPIDVRVTEGKRLLIGCEVKQKVINEPVAEELADRVKDAGGDRALTCALAEAQAPLDRTTIRRDAAREGVIGLVAESMAEVFEIALVTGSAPVDDFLADFPAAMAEAMEDVSASVEGRQYWAVLCATWDAEDAPASA